MAETAERKPRKSVAFADEQTLVDTNGDTETNGTHAGDKESAESHSKHTEGGDGDEAVDEVTAMLADLKKKKPSKKTPKPEESEAAAADDDDEIDLSALKKKKKKKVKAPEDDFEAKLAEAGANEDSTPAAPATDDATTGVQEGDLTKGTGIWAHDSNAPVTYESLLHRFFTLLHDSHPDLAVGGGGKSYKIPPPQCLREGNKKTIFANIAEICKRMKRTDEHVTQFLFAELGTSGSVDGSRRLVIKGRFQQKQIENVLRRYIMEYVTCKTCRSPDTELNKGENRLYFVTCNSCGSRRSVTAIKTGFSAQVGKRKRMIK
ncbi:translation initiation factor eIF-2 beta subunit [Elasticomyces elasticus]|uniref:Translation initiation factor eIF-2 beta subunit n=1 Tax=Elasticomyces elasticus TaxID=574655 RepID=A0AAN7WQY8_9PEZI|nr:translation initiation factor eIF-2 beta subunit [Elasticomyces elasticus]KAK3666066.1 translation initiation factor eIF-2 beta subunit [Elasticomyces elasticus]KAK4929553.1 translation initiation factor eIF-2 beta subunit [Elasticomyces elasticus]KAK4962041.1 translation initiation factor eIF-2 beta subunit [Elasticomyces elasticus]KAK4973407.1 translation initiation factor eIF-2 beta subunit [Elasticomyces elasticus]